uniref:Uncharacterized protein n=1 Tax=Anguilla anguilla TaxID=7936 RepID=A0A0E9P9Z5_ANGAN
MESVVSHSTVFGCLWKLWLHKESGNTKHLTDTLSITYVMNAHTVPV